MFLDTLYFSTFSIIDTLFVTGGAPEVNNVDYRKLQSSIVRSFYQWINCSTNQAVIGETSREFITQIPGFYKIVAISATCSDTSSCFEAKPISSDITLIDNQTLKNEDESSRIYWIKCESEEELKNNESRILNVPDTGYYAAVLSKFAYSDTSKCIPMFAVAYLKIHGNKNYRYFQIQLVKKLRFS